MKYILFVLISFQFIYAEKENLEHIFQPFNSLRELAQKKSFDYSIIRKNMNEYDIKPGMNEQELKKLYKKLSLKCHPDKGGNEQEFNQLHDAYEQALELLNPTPEIKFIMNEGTYVIGQIPEKVSIPPFHAGLVKQSNDDPQIGKLVCFGPQHQTINGNRIKVRNGKASDDCFRAQADESDFGCMETSAASLYKQNLTCRENCWKGGAPKKAILGLVGKKTKPQPADCSLPE